ncbi:MAG: membrane dipeptidase [Pseudomonadales bacterium]
MASSITLVRLPVDSNFLSAASRESSQARSELARQYIEANGLEAGSDAAVAATRRIYAENPFARAAMKDVLDHVDHVVKIAGIDHIGIGSDFDGVGDTLPTGFKDVSDYPNFINGLLERGYSEDQIEQILGGNLMRVWAEVERYAELKKELKKELKQ